MLVPSGYCGYSGLLGALGLVALMLGFDVGVEGGVGEIFLAASANVVAPLLVLPRPPRIPPQFVLILHFFL